jgi:hypothetical protein
MNTWIRVARTQLTERNIFVIQPWIVLVLDLAIVLMIVGSVPDSGGQPRYTGALAGIYITLIVTGALSIGRQVPFVLALGVSRRSFYAGTALAAVAVAAVYGLGLTVLQLIERATGGWGMHLEFFRVPYLLSGPWYLTWLTSFTFLALMMVWGMWFGIVYRRWNLMGLLFFIIAQAAAIGLALTIIGQADDWSRVSHFFTTLTIGGLTGLLAALAAVLLAGGYATMRRVTV